MKIGDLEISVVQDGTWRLDGGSFFGQVPKELWDRQAKADGKNRVRLGLNCLLIRSPQGNILVDTGMGKKVDARRKEDHAAKGGRLLVGLRALGLRATDIHYVVLTHLHFAHAGGATKFNRNHDVVPSFPRARYLVRDSSWDDATHLNERNRPSYEPLDYLPLAKSGQLELLKQDREIVQGVWVKATDGHCRGHQMVFINHAGRKVAFAGDIIPTPFHVSLPYITAYDQFPEETLECKRQLLRSAEDAQWLLVFSHGHDVHAGYVTRQKHRAVVTPVDLTA